LIGIARRKRGHRDQHPPGDWESISDEMWRKVGKQVGFSNKGNWQMIETIGAKN
jgi:hypothetical protein